MYKLCAIALSLVLYILLSSCERDFSSAPSLSSLRFSADTLSFDTVFSGEVSPTAYITLKNTGSNDVTIASIALQGGENSHFGININGQNATEVSNVRLAHDDSLYIFVNVKNPTADDGNAISLISDKILVSSDQNTWSATLLALLMNVVRVSGSINSDALWAQDSIPYYITDSLLIAPDATLSISGGTTLLMGTNANIIVEGQLLLNGSDLSKIRLRQIRQDAFYSDIPGQWGALYLRQGAAAQLSGVEISCATDGIIIDSLASLNATNVWLRDVSHGGISASHASVSLANSLITNVGGPALQLSGAQASLSHVTVANFFSWASRSNESIRVLDSTAVLSVVNSIISGSLSNEVIVDSLHNANVSFSNTWIKARATNKSKIEADSLSFVNCIAGSDVSFADRSNANYHLLSVSEAVGLADPSVALSLPLDYEGVPRIDVDTIQPGALQSLVEQ